MTRGGNGSTTGAICWREGNWMNGIAIAHAHEHAAEHAHEHAHAVAASGGVDFFDLAFDVLHDAVVDTLYLIPFLLVTYLAMEWLEHKTGEKTQNAIRRAGAAGPAIGAILGVVPQCGFSAAASTLYAGRVVTLGTLFAVFLSTSDEMLPIFIAEQVPLNVLFTVIGTIIASLITGEYGLTLAGTHFVNLSLFLAFAVLFPDVQVMLFFIIPIKMKWLAIIDGVYYALVVISSLAVGDWIGVVLPIAALLNFLVFVWPEVKRLLGIRKHLNSRQSVNFRQAVRQQQQQKGYHHKCAVCGRTDADYPNLQFRYCSKCAGYHCFCQDHIFTHVHFTE